MSEALLAEYILDVLNVRVLETYQMKSMLARGRMEGTDAALIAQLGGGAAKKVCGVTARLPQGAKKSRRPMSGGRRSANGCAA